MYWLTVVCQYHVRDRFLSEISNEEKQMKMNALEEHRVAAKLVALAFAFGLLGAEAVRAAAPSVTCVSLTGMAITAADIGLPTTGATVTTATLVPANAAGNSNGEYCLVRGAIHPVDPTAPNILIEVNLPTSWNRKGLQLGGGGYNG